jgi:hypothetical protein
VIKSAAYEGTYFSSLAATITTALVKLPHLIAERVEKSLRSDAPRMAEGFTFL